MTPRLLRNFNLPALMALALSSFPANGIAAERVNWKTLQKRLTNPATCKAGSTCDGQISAREIEVRTVDGRTRLGKFATLEEGRLVLEGGAQKEIVSPGDVSQIRIRRRYLRFFEHSAGAYSLGAAVTFGACDQSGCNDFGVAVGAILALPVFTYAVASTPVTLAMDGVAALLPAHAFEIVP